jgi:hypothetical protein
MRQRYSTGRVVAAPNQCGVRVSNSAGFTGREDHVAFTEHEPQLSVEDVSPFVPLEGLEDGLIRAAASGEDELVGLDTAGAPGQRQDRLPSLAVDRAQVNPWVTGGWRIDQLVERDAVRSGRR